MSANKAAKQQLISQYITTAEGRQKLAASMTQPLRTRRDYLALGRKTFMVEQLPDGALPIYDKDPDVAAYVVAEDSESIESHLKGRRVMFPTFEIAANPKIPLTEVRARRYNLVERSQDLARAAIQAAEDERVFAVMDAIAQNGFDSIVPSPNADIPVVAPITSDALADAYALVESHDLRVARVFMNAKDYADLRKFNRDVLDMESQRELLKTGMVATLWGASVITSRIVPEGTVYVTCEPEFFGRMPVRTELTVLSADDPVNRAIGWSVFEELGIGAFNPRGLARLTVTR